MTKWRAALLVVCAWIVALGYGSFLYSLSGHPFTLVHPQGALVAAATVGFAALMYSR